MDYQYIIIIIGVIIAAILLYFGLKYFLKNKSLNSENVSSMDIDALINALGGTSNIKDVSSSPSKLTVLLKDTSAVDIKKIQELGASGIVEGKESLSMIFGKESPLIEQDFKARK